MVTEVVEEFEKVVRVYQDLFVWEVCGRGNGVVQCWRRGVCYGFADEVGDIGSFDEAVDDFFA